MKYPNAAQLKNVTADRSNPASRNQSPKVEKMSKRGIPAEKPKNNIVITRGCKNARILCCQFVIFEYLNC